MHQGSTCRRYHTVSEITDDKWKCVTKLNTDIIKSWFSHTLFLYIKLYKMNEKYCNSTSRMNY